MTTTSASRSEPPAVAPVIQGGMTFRQIIGSADSEFGQVGGLLGAFDAGGTLLWWLKVYDNRRQPGLEGDVQDVFFRTMTAEADGSLTIVAEDGRRFRVDPATRTATPLPAAPRPDAGGIPL